VLREYLVSEAIGGAGVPTTRALAAVTTASACGAIRPCPEPCSRGCGEPSSLWARSSILRRGAIQKPCACWPNTQSPAMILTQQGQPSLPRPARRRHRAPARLVSQWMLFGFIHGVMNTDNMSISGESIDFGPCAFMELITGHGLQLHRSHGGRYAYGNQPNAALWNLARLAEALLPVLIEEAGRRSRGGCGE